MQENCPIAAELQAVSREIFCAERIFLYTSSVHFPRGFVLVLLGLLLSPAAEPLSPGFTPIERLDPEHLKATRDARLRLARERVELPVLGVYHDFRAVIHVHAEDSDHTKGTRLEVLEAAKKTGVRIVMFSDHGGPNAETWRGVRDGVLFFAGQENGGAGWLRFPAAEQSGTANEPELRFLSHVEERPGAPSAGFDGMEICNRHTDAKLDRGLERHLVAALRSPDAWAKVVRDFTAYPDEFFGAGCDYRPGIIAQWDQETRQKKFVGIGANDAHQNQTFQGVTFDPYEVSFRNLSTHILARELEENQVRQALREGRVYVAHDWLCDPTGFAFGAENNLGVFTMGDAVPIVGTTRVAAITPVAAHLKLFRDGALVEETRGTNLAHRAREAGAYRLEAWLEIAGEPRPWIYANPVYLRLPSPAELTLPPSDLAASVEARRDLPYQEGELEDGSKHKLDLYLPTGSESAPVFVFIHGGAWRSGDRSQYPAVANRFARAGILTAVPGYRLAPKHPHPAQIEDVAAAVAWVFRHIAGHGGDPGRVYVGGHSAGGHLAALLALDDSYLQAHGLSRTNIRGTITLSGVYDLTLGLSQASVFGTNRQVRQSASPQFHIRAPAPPFLVTYCQWDYLTLPFQARRFHASLRQAGIDADLVFIPGESHISEVVHLPRDNDPTAAAILKFIGQ